MKPKDYDVILYTIPRNAIRTRGLQHAKHIQTDTLSRTDLPNLEVGFSIKRFGLDVAHARLRSRVRLVRREHLNV